ncbi:MAG: antitoxin family protein [Bryobacteraceae bacterium]
MSQRVEAIYENGVFRPVSRLSLNESQRVILTITDIEAELIDTDLLERARAEVAAMPDPPTIEEVRSLLSAIPGSMAEEVMAQRGEY